MSDEAEKRETEITSRDAKAFDLASETVKQLLALATGIVGVTVAFAKDIAPATNQAKWILVLGGGVLVISLLFGVCALQSLSGQLGSARITKPNVYASAITFFVVAQWLLFVGGTGGVVAATLISLPSGKSAAPDPPPQICCEIGPSASSSQ